ncbi:MAG: hypothetical protein AAF547_07905 [Actinomycetota bacterium]
MIARLFDFCRGLLSLALILLLLVGVPAVLLVIVGYPLPTERPSLELIRTHIEDGNVPDAFIIKTLAVVVWFVWAQLAVAVLAETVALVRGRVARRAPVLPGMQLFAGKLVASTVLVISAFLPNRSVVAAPIVPIEAVDVAVDLAAGDGGPNSLQTLIDARHGPGSAATVMGEIGLDGTFSSASGAVAGAGRDGGRTGVVASAEVAPGRYRTASGDSWWDMAERLLGDGMRWSELRDLNAGRTMLTGDVITDRTEAVAGGWDLRVPVDADPALLSDPGVDDDNGSTNGVATLPAEPSSPLIEAMKPHLLVYEGSEEKAVAGPSIPYQVVDGDNLWDIADRHLGDPFRWPEIFERSTDLTQTFGRTISDPNLIWPDAILRLPVDAVDVPPADPGLVAEVLGAASSLSEATTPAPEGAAPIEADALAEAAAAARDATHDLDDPSAAAEQGQAEAPEDSTGAADGGGPIDRLIDALTEPAGAAVGAGGLLVATGLVGLLDRARMARRSEAGPGAVPEPPPLELVDIETVLRNRADEQTAHSVRAVLASLTDRQVRPDEPLPAPEVIRIGRDRIEVVQQGPDPDLPAAWSTAAVSGHPGLAGRSVAVLGADHLPQGPQPEQSSETPSIAPAVVTIGGGLLLNLEAVGVVALDGPVEAVAGLVRSMVHELAAGPDRRAVEVRVSDWLPGAELHDRVRCGPLDGLVEELGPWLEAAELALTASGGFSAYALRVAGRVDAVPGPLVVFADAADATALAPLMQRARRHALPLAVVCAGAGGELPVPPTVRVVTDGDRVTIEPFGLTAAAQPLDEELLVGMTALVNHARRAPMMARNDLPTVLPADHPTDPAQAPTEETPEHDIDTELPTEDEELTEREGDDDEGMLIRVLGPVQIEGGPPVEFTEEQRSVLTFLALVGPSTETQLRAAVWPDDAIDDRRFAEVIDALRSRLGHRLFPDAGDGRYRVRSVITDLGSARRWLAEASAIQGERARNLLELALSDVRGVPFSGVSSRYWQWTADHQLAVATQAVTMLVDACFDLCDVAYAANDLSLAVWACDVAALVDPLHETVATRRVQLLGVLGEDQAAAELVAGWEAAYRSTVDRRPPGGPRAALRPREVVAPHVG